MLEHAVRDQLNKTAPRVMAVLLFTVKHPDKEDDSTRHINPDSITAENDPKVESSLTQAESGSTFQFERLGYFTVDPDTQPGALVFNRMVTLRDSWSKQQRRK